MVKPTTYCCLAVLFSLGMMTGCATTSQPPPSFSQLGHFEQFPLNTAIFRLRFTGPAHMSQGTAEEITLLHAAKTTIEAGYRYFQVLDISKAPPVQRTMLYPNAFGAGWYSPYRSRWPYYSHWNDPLYDQVVYQVAPPDVSYTIKCSKLPSAQDQAFDAQLILNSLGSKYRLLPDGSPAEVEAAPAKAVQR